MSEPFRVASQPSAPIKGGTSVALSPGDRSSITERGNPGLYTHQAVRGVPLTVSHFKLEHFYDSKHYDALRAEIDAVDEYIQAQARKRGLSDSTKSYDEIVDEILAKIGKSDNELPEHTFQRIKAATQAMQRMEEAQLPAVLDFDNLTADEIRATAAR